MSILGTRVVRSEDPRLLTAGATYVEDLRLPALDGAAYVTFVRSPLAHARITEIDASAALAEPGVVAVLTAEDLDDVPYEPGGPSGEPLLARDVVRFAGEPVALIVTERQYQGEDAAELVSVDYEPLTAVISAEDSIGGETLLFPETGTNVVGEGGAEKFDDARVRRLRGGGRGRDRQPASRARPAGGPCGRRGLGGRPADVLGEHAERPRGTRHRGWRSSASTPTRIRVITPDVGGGFGAKIGIDRDAVLVAWAARRLGRALRWAETRNENILAMTHGRAQRQTVKIGGSRDGRIAAYRLDIVQDCGAYARLGPYMPTLTMLMASGVYDIPKVEAAYRAVVTNTAPIAAYRGAGRPEATAAIERAVDLFAAEIGMDAADVRRRNFVAPDQFPFTTPTGATYDTGEYAKALDTVLEAAGYAELRADQARRRERGDVVQLGIGVSAYVEITGGGPEDGETASLSRARRRHGDRVRPGVRRTGRGTRRRGRCSSATSSACRWTRSRCGTATPTSLRGRRARSARGRCSSAAPPCTTPRWRSRTRRASWPPSELEADPADLVLDNGSGTWSVRGVPGSGVGWGRLAERAGPRACPPDDEFATELSTFPFGAHVAVVEVDTETGKVAARTARHGRRRRARCSTRCSPRASATEASPRASRRRCWKRWSTTTDGNPVTSTLMDYAFITATELPSFELVDHGDPDDDQPARRQGHRRGRHDRRDTGRTERRGGRARPPRHPPHRHAGHPRTRLDRDQRSEDLPVNVTITVNGEETSTRWRTVRCWSTTCATRSVSPRPTSAATRAPADRARCSWAESP